jgi:predicted nucleic acid-binding protein
MSLGLGPGEASLVLTPPNETVVLDDRAARMVALAEGRTVVGLVGLVLRAALNEEITQAEAKALFRKLAESGFHLSGALLGAIEEELNRRNARAT